MLSALTSDANGVAPFIPVPNFGSNPGGLQMLAFVPDGLRPRAPLVVNLHGCKQDPRAYSIGVGWLELANEHGFALLVPAQTTINNRQRCFNWFDPAKVAVETASIDQMIQWMLANHALDQTRVFITGLSAGGAMASNMLALYPERFAGGAIIAGLPYGAATNLFEALDAMANGRSQSAAEWGEAIRGASQHRGPWPRISVWHGTADTRVHPGNAGAIVQQWLSVHGLVGAVAVEDQRHGAQRRAWHSSDRREAVEVYSIPGMQHGAPVASGGDTALFLIDAGLPSSSLIAQFWGVAPLTPPPRSGLLPMLRRMVRRLQSALGIGGG